MKDIQENDEHGDNIETELTGLQLQWLNAMGGRDHFHVLKQGDRYYVMMGKADRTEEEVDVPGDAEILRFFR